MRFAHFHVGFCIFILIAAEWMRESLAKCLSGRCLWLSDMLAACQNKHFFQSGKMSHFEMYDIMSMRMCICLQRYRVLFENKLTGGQEEDK